MIEGEAQRKKQEADWRRWSVEMNYMLAAVLISFLVANVLLVCVLKSSDRERTDHRAPPTFLEK
jgi:hypothetical protein